MTRRENLQLLSWLGMSTTIPTWILASEPIMKRVIPSSGEQLPVIGVGTWQTFDVGTSPTERDPLKDVLRQLVEQQGSVIDSSPMYGNAERVIGDLSNAMGINNKLFMATKVWTSGREAGIRQMENSFSLMQRKQMDLMQIHNLVDWKTHYKTLQQWKEEKRIRYIGITHYVDSAHDEVAQIIQNNNIDFIQINYSIANRHAENNLLQTAIDNKVGVIVNQPFGGGGLFGRVRGKSLPEWAKEFDCNSWGCFFLKFILAHPAVTCVIPGTAKRSHMIDNLSAGVGKLPNEKDRKLMIDFMGT